MKGSILWKFQVSIQNPSGIIPIPIFGDLNRGETGIEGDLNINILKIFHLGNCHGKYQFAFRLYSKCLERIQISWNYQVVIQKFSFDFPDFQRLYCRSPLGYIARKNERTLAKIVSYVLQGVIKQTIIKNRQKWSTYETILAEVRSFFLAIWQRIQMVV